jgi:hypothetical protein
MSKPNYVGPTLIVVACGAFLLALILLGIAVFAGWI